MYPHLQSINFGGLMARRFGEKSWESLALHLRLAVLIVSRFKTGNGRLKAKESQNLRKLLGALSSSVAPS